MQAKYKELLPKYFPNGIKQTGKKTDKEREAENTALKALRDEMPKNRIVIKGLPQHVRDKLGTDADSAFFSANTLAKQFFRHSGIPQGEYRSILAKTKDGAESYHKGPLHVGMAIESRMQYAAILKATEDLMEVYLVSIYDLKGGAPTRFKKNRH